MQIKLIGLTPDIWRTHRTALARLEAAIYEPARRDSIESLERAALNPRSVSVLAPAGAALAAFCIGAPLELFDCVSGVRTDPRFGRGDTLYSADLAVAPAWRGRGLASALKRRQLQQARVAGYRFVAGRNRVGVAQAMWRLNESLDACPVQYLAHDYDDELESRDCLYYHIDLWR